MTMLTVTQAAQRVSRSVGAVRRYCQLGRVRATKDRHPTRGSVRVWYVDIDDLTTYVTTGAGGDSRPEADTPLPDVPPPPAGQLTTYQRQCVARETHHQLLDLQPVPIAPGAVRATWSDGETFAILPNGDTDAYNYLKPHILEELCRQI